jgi:hypothetical protein
MHYFLEDYFLDDKKLIRTPPRLEAQAKATVTHSLISNRVHTVSKPYRPGFTRIDPHRNPCQFLRIL